MKKAKTAEQMMEELLRLYPGSDWEISSHRSLNEDGKYELNVFAVFGYRHTDGYTEPYWMDKEGGLHKTSDIVRAREQGWFETDEGGLGYSIQEAVEAVYNEVMKRRGKHEHT